METNKLQHQFNKYIATVDSGSEELKAAQNIQQILLTDDIPSCKKLNCAGISVPAYQLSGDYYDFIYDQQNGRYWVLIGDVMGKGIPASLMMVMIRSTVRVLVEVCHTPGELLAQLNNHLIADLTRLRAYATVFCGMFDLKKDEFQYASAGHPSAIHLNHRKGSVTRLKSKGAIIGVLHNRIYQNYSMGLSSNELLVICTDGVLEAMNQAKKQYGYDRLIDIVEANHSLDPTDLIKVITEDVRHFSEDYRRDDVTVVAVRREKEA